MNWTSFALGVSATLVTEAFAGLLIMACLQRSTDKRLERSSQPFSNRNYKPIPRSW